MNQWGSRQMSHDKAIRADKDKPASKTGLRRLRILILFTVLVASLSVFLYKIYLSYGKAITGYGEDWESLAILDSKQPDALSGGDLTHFKFGNISFAQEPYNLESSKWTVSSITLSPV